MDSLLRITRYASRQLLKSPGAAAVAVIAMGLGIGLTAGMVAILDGLILRGLPFENPQQLMHLENNRLADGEESLEVGQHDFEVWLERQTSFVTLAAYHGGTANLADGELPERFTGTWISPGFLDLLGEEPLLGRGLRAQDSDPESPLVVLIGHHVWQKRYGGNPNVVGKAVTLNSEPATIVGVLKEGFRFPVREDLWMPLRLQADQHPRGSDELATLEVFGRLRTDRSVDQAMAEMGLIADQLAQEYPVTNEGLGVVIKPYMEEFIDQETRDIVGTMFIAVILVLVIACFNVANLLIGRASLRGRELAICTALGSKRRHVVAGMLMEAFLLAAGGAIVGLGLAQVSIKAFDAAIQTTEPPFWIHFYLSPTVFLATVGFTLLATLVSGLVPALQASRTDVRSVLSDATRGSTGFRVGRISRIMVVTQVAASAALTIAAGLAVRSVLEAQSYEHAFNAERLLSARVGLFEGDYPEPQDRVQFFETLERRLRESGEVEKAAIGTVLPTETAIGAGGQRYERPGETYDRPHQRPWSRWVAVTPGYFDTLGVSILAGRDFSAADNDNAFPVAIVNEDFARREWPGENPIGRRIDLWQGEEAEAQDPDAGVVEVVGVVPNLRFAEFDNADDQHAIYVPLAQNPVRFAWAIVRTKGEPLAFAQPLRESVLAIDPTLPLYFVRSMDQVLENTLFFPRILGVLFSIFGAAALFLACVGLYGLMAFAVSQRSQEMGVRMALGAHAGNLLSMVLRQGLKQTALGLGIGLVLGALMGQLLSSVLYNVRTGDPLTYALVPLVLIAVAALACWMPARRAASVDPMTALHCD